MAIGSAYIAQIHPPVFDWVQNRSWYAKNFSATLGKLMITCETERKGTAETLIAALTQNDKFTLES